MILGLKHSKQHHQHHHHLQHEQTDNVTKQNRTEHNELKCKEITSNACRDGMTNHTYALTNRKRHSNNGPVIIPEYICCLKLNWISFWHLN